MKPDIGIPEEKLKSTAVIANALLADEIKGLTVQRETTVWILRTHIG